MRWLVVTVVLLGAAGPAVAQTETDGRVWWNVTAQERTGTESPWRWYFEFQGRTRDGVSALDQLLIRPAIGYDLTSRSSLWGGYGYTPSYPADSDVLTENRLWQQYLWAGPGLGSALQWRSRLEQRWIEGNDRVAWRYRQFLRLARNLNSTPGGPTFVAYDEFKFHLNDTVRTAAGFDQNRAFVGVGFQTGKDARLEVGYLNQVIKGNPDRMNHILLVFLNATY